MSATPVAVGIGQYAIGEGEACLTVYGLGSCVALILYDPDSGRGGLAHVLLPGGPARGALGELPAKLAADALELLCAALGKAPGLRGAIVGGARLFQVDEPSEGTVGRRNVDALREGLRLRSIPLLAEDTGGTAGRTVRFELPEGTLRVRTLRENWKTLPGLSR